MIITNPSQKTSLILVTWFPNKSHHRQLPFLVFSTIIVQFSAGNIPPYLRSGLSGNASPPGYLPTYLPFQPPSPSTPYYPEFLPITSSYLVIEDDLHCIEWLFITILFNNGYFFAFMDILDSMKYWLFMTQLFLFHMISQLVFFL